MKKGCVILIEKCFESEQKNSKGEVLHDCNVPKIIDSEGCRGVSGGWAVWAIAHPDFGRIEGAAMRHITTCPPSVWQPLTPLSKILSYHCTGCTIEGGDSLLLQSCSTISDTSSSTFLLGIVEFVFRRIIGLS